MNENEFTSKGSVLLIYYIHIFFTNKYVVNLYLYFIIKLNIMLPHTLK